MLSTNMSDSYESNEVEVDHVQDHQSGDTASQGDEILKMMHIVVTSFDQQRKFQMDIFKETMEQIQANSSAEFQKHSMKLEEMINGAKHEIEAWTTFKPLQNMTSSPALGNYTPTLSQDEEQREALSFSRRHCITKSTFQSWTLE